MTQLIPLLIVALLAGCACALLPPRRGAFANSVGTHAGHITRATDVALATRHLLVRPGSDASHVTLGNASSRPIGVATDEASAAEAEVNVALLGSANTTLRMVASETIAAGVPVFAAADGKVQDAPAAPGLYYMVGMSLTAATANTLIEVDPCVSQLLTVE